METLEQKIQRVLREDISIAAYDPSWPDSFARERDHLRACLPRDLVGRIEHFGSTAVPGLDAKPIVDVLVEVTDLEATKERIVPLLEAQGYDYFWRPLREDGPPFYAWFIGRDPATGARTHHLHMAEAHLDELWNCLLFRDYLIEYHDVAREYLALKLRLAAEYPDDRVAYTRGKSSFVQRITEQAKRHYLQS